MLKTRIKISGKGQVAIPKKIREKFSSDIFEIELEDDRIILKPAESILSIGGSLKEYAQNYQTSQPRDKEDEDAWKKHVKEKFGDN